MPMLYEAVELEGTCSHFYSVWPHCSWNGCSIYTALHIFLIVCVCVCVGGGVVTLPLACLHSANGKMNDELKRSR
jgi:hypothetical protein